MILREFHVKDSKGLKRIKVEYKCERCNKIHITFKDNLRLRVGFICRPCRSRENAIKRRGLASWKRGKSFPNLQKEKHHGWNGGKYINKAGYVIISVKSGSVNRKSGWENYRPEHIVIMEQILNRKLEKDECIHHIDGNRQNNKLENLALIKSNAHHRYTHMSLQKIGYELYKKGVIYFDKNKGEYFLK